METQERPLPQQESPKEGLPLESNQLTPIDWANIPKTHNELTLSPEGQKKFDQCVQESRRMIARYIPNGTTVTPTQFLIGWAPLGDLTASYHGWVSQGKETIHLIEMNLPAGFYPLTLEEEEELISVVAHELLHQRHAELAGDSFGQYLGNIPDGVTITYDTMKALTSRVSPARNPEKFTLKDAVIEGAAEVGELYLLRKREQELKASKRRAQFLLGALFQRKALDEYEQRLKGIRKTRLQELRELKFRVRASTDDPYYVGTLRLSKGLYKRYGLENLFEIIRHIDLEKCEDIDESSPEFWKISKDPQLLPGLEYLASETISETGT